MAALLSAPAWEGLTSLTVFSWADAFFSSSQPERSALGATPSLNALAQSALRHHLLHNPSLLPQCLNRCYSPDATLAAAYFSVFSEVAVAPQTAAAGVLGEPHQLLALVLCKLTDRRPAVRRAALDVLAVTVEAAWGSAPKKVRFF